MPKIIKNFQIIEDDWTLLTVQDDESVETITLPPGKVIVPFEVWINRRADLESRPQIGIWLEGDKYLEEAAVEAARFDVIAIHFPKFIDGRGYSAAVLLRSRHGYTGELRAVGEVLRDQIFYLKRCGFDAFALRSDQNAEWALTSLCDFTEPYQAGIDNPLPLFRRVARSVTPF